MSFQVAKFKFEFNPLQAIKFPAYKGSTLRGAFGNTFKRIVCVLKQKDCTSCMLKAQCVYAYIFETALFEQKGLVPANARYAPHPFVIEPPEVSQDIFEPGQKFNMNVVLIGKAIQYLPYFVLTLSEMGRKGIGKGRGKFFLDKVIGDGNAGAVEVYQHEEKTLLSNYSKLSFQDFIDKTDGFNTVQNFQISFHTPTRMKYQNRLVDQLEFHIIMRSLLRRIRNLAVFHGDGLWDVDHKLLIAEAEKIRTINSNLKWHDWSRYSSRQNSRMKLGGVIGNISFEGELKQFLPYLFLGEFIHLGKATAFGLGRYEIIPL